MTDIKGLTDRPAALPSLVGFVFNRVRTVMREENWGEIRPSHLRVIGAIPTGGVSVSELAMRIGMSTQGAGQFVAALAARGYVTVARDPSDRRTRVVRRTRAGNALMRRFVALTATIEREWAHVVGPERYAVFRAVLEELARAEGGRPPRPAPSRGVEPELG